MAHRIPREHWRECIGPGIRSVDRGRPDPLLLLDRLLFPVDLDPALDRSDMGRVVQQKLLVFQPLDELVPKE